MLTREHTGDVLNLWAWEWCWELYSIPSMVHDCHLVQHLFLLWAGSLKETLQVFCVCVCKKESATECIWARTRKRERQYVGGTYESERGWVVLTFLLLACSHAHSLSLSLSSTFIIRIFSAYLCVELMNHQHNSPHFLFILIKQSCMFLLQSPVPTYKINGVSHKHIFAFSIAQMYTSTSLKDRDWGKRGQK